MLYFVSLLCFNLLYFIDIKYSSVLCVRGSDFTESQAEVSAVFVDRKSNENSDKFSNSEDGRFLREPMFRYEPMINVPKKIIITVKLNGNNYIDENEEFIPIEHVFDNDVRDHIRLLDPYVLRMRRQPALQAYRLNHIANVSAIFTNKRDFSKKLIKKVINKLNNNIGVINGGKQNTEHYEKNLDDLIRPYRSATVPFNSCDPIKPENVIRKKRDKYNLIVENPEVNHRNTFNNIQSINANDYINAFNDDPKEYTKRTIQRLDNETLYDLNGDDEIEHRVDNNNNHIYSLNKLDPNVELWHSVKLQLLQKTIDDKGKTVWSDLTQGDQLSIGTSHKESKRNGIAARYHLISRLNRSQKSLPASLCLLKKVYPVDDDMDDKFIVVPSIDVVDTDGENIEHEKYNGNGSGKKKTVLVRMNRALSISNESEDVKMAVRGPLTFLTTLHKDKIESQVDIEARADNNEVIRVGSSARISTIVSDATRHARTIVTIHAANTGLAAAHFRVAVRDCEPQVLEAVNAGNDVVSTERMLIPPYHTKRIQLEIGNELPPGDVHCIVNLINDKKESVAARDVILKKSDRCFCVWHCNCVCLGVDPRLICNEMSNAKLTASGISSEDGPRHQRCLQYPDDTIIDGFVMVFGVLSALLFMGLIKACLGFAIPQVGMWGLNRIVKLPRHIERYHEPWLRLRRVIHDGNGWPVHPDTKKRTVRLLSWFMEFILNLFFFILLPSLAIRDLILTWYEKISGPIPKKTTKSKKERILGPGKIFKHDKDDKYVEMGSPKKGKKFGKLFTKKAKTKSQNKEKACCCKSDQDDTAYILSQMKNSCEYLNH